MMRKRGVSDEMIKAYIIKAMTSLDKGIETVDEGIHRIEDSIQELDRVEDPIQELDRVEDPIQELKKKEIDTRVLMLIDSAELVLNSQEIAARELEIAAREMAIVIEEFDVEMLNWIKVSGAGEIEEKIKTITDMQLKVKNTQQKASSIRKRITNLKI